MVTKILVLVLLVILVFAMFRLLTGKRHKTIERKPKSESLMADVEDESKWGICKSCGQRRMIMKEEMCALCWSSSQTHGLK